LPDREIFKSRGIPLDAINVSHTFRHLFNLVIEDWQKIRFSDKVSKELICILTIIICLFLQSVKNRNLADFIFESTEYENVWKLFLHYSDDIEITNSNIKFDIFRIMFTMWFANEISLKEPVARKKLLD